MENAPESYDQVIDFDLTKFKSNEIIEKIKTEYFNHFKSELELNEKENSIAIYNKVRTLFANSLIDYEYYLRDANGKKYNTSTESLFDRYFERTFKSQIQSQYLDNIRTHYLKNETLNLELLVDEYNYLATLNYNAYNNNHNAYKDKMKNISTNGDTVLYHPTTDAQFGYFIHTLISFDSIKDNLTLLKEIKDKDEYDIQYKNLISKVTVKARNIETGLVDEDAKEIGIGEVLQEYNEIKNGYSSNEERMQAFIQFMFKYTNDTATLNQGMPYVVGTNGYSSMVEEFNNEAILLMTGKDSKGNTVIEGKAGNMSSPTISDLDSLCITEYGIHLLYYIGDVNSFDIPYLDSSKVYIQNEDIAGSEKFNLYTKTINPLTKKTYFDKMFDLVYPATSGEVYSSNNGYSDFEKNITEYSKTIHKVTKYVSKINATKTSF